MPRDKTKITVYDMEASVYIKKLATKLKEIKEIEMPEWAHFVKTGPGTSRPPIEIDWWYTRAAALLRQIYLKGVVGAGRLSVKFGTRKHRGVRPKQFYRSSRKILRVIMQQSEKAGLLEKVKEGRAGRRMTKKGKAFMDEVAQK
jgi:small subunit ribosomal protein S19e